MKPLLVNQVKTSVIYSSTLGSQAEQIAERSLRGLMAIYRLATSRLANIFGNGTIHRHDKKLKR